MSDVHTDPDTVGNDADTYVASPNTHAFDADNAPLLQTIFAQLAQLAELRGETADDVLDAATGGKGIFQGDLQDKAEPWLNDLKLRLENELASEA